MGAILKIELDADPINPREDYDHIGHIFSFLRNDGFSDKDVWNHLPFSRSEAVSDDVNITERMNAEGFYLPIYMYSHSGTTIRTTPFSCPWDSGLAGFIYVSKKEVYKEYSCKRVGKKILKRVMALLEAEVKELDHYMTGNVYGFVLEDEETGDTIDSCWGFIGEADPKKNGIADHIPTEYAYTLENPQMPY